MHFNFRKHSIVLIKSHHRCAKQTLVHKQKHNFKFYHSFNWKLFIKGMTCFRKETQSLLYYYFYKSDLKLNLRNVWQSQDMDGMVAQFVFVAVGRRGRVHMWYNIINWKTHCLVFNFIQCQSSVFDSVFLPPHLQLTHVLVSLNHNTCSQKKWSNCGQKLKT